MMPIAEDERWQAEDDIRTLNRAAEIEADAERMKKAKAEAKRQKAVLESIIKSGKKDVDEQPAGEFF